MSSTLPSAFTGLNSLAVEDRIDAEIVVVPRDQIERHVRVRKALRGELHPRLDPLVHQPVQQQIAVGLVARETLRLVARAHEGVEADVGDVALEPRELLVAARRAMHAEELRLVAVAVADDRHDRLAGQVAGDQRDVRFVRRSA